EALSGRSAPAVLPVIADTPPIVPVAPVPAVAAGQQVGAAPVHPAADGSPVEILVAEDNEVNQLVFSQILEQLGREFRIVGDGRRAVEAWRRLSPRIILMDVSMPEMNGLEATSAIRIAEATEGRARTPIVGVTAHAL